ITDLHPDGTSGLELGFGVPNLWSYRAFRFPWQTTAIVAVEDTLAFGITAVDGPRTRILHLSNPQSTDFTINAFVSTDPRFTLLTPLPLTVPANVDLQLQVAYAPDTLGPMSGRLYLRSVSDSILVARSVELTGTGTGPQLSIDDVTDYEGNEGLTPFVFTV